MFKKATTILLLATTLFSNNNVQYKNGCPIPDVLMQSIKLTENETQHPYFIRTNDKENYNKFKSIISKYEHNFTFKKDPYIVDCKNEVNCVKMSIELINSGITNLDLGLFQVNYNSYKYNLFTYFDDYLSYRNACSVVLSKMKMTKNWSWETLAAYHSLTPSLNKIYKDKLISNYRTLNGNTNIPKKVYINNQRAESKPKIVFKDGKSFFNGNNKYASQN